MDGNNSGTTCQPPRERRVSRRDALRSVGRSMTLGGGVALASGVAAASSVDAFTNAKPNHVTITTDDTEFLNRYRPLLDTRHVPYQNRPTLYGWKATSPEHETDAAVYCAEYAVQKDILKLTSHAGDHEWIYVFVDSKNGEVREVSYTAYHWLRGYVLNPPVNTENGGYHPMFQIAPTYHNYVPLTSDTDNSVLFEPRPLGDYASRSGPLYQWLANGMKEDMEPGAVHNPWDLDSSGPLDAWWAREGSGQLNRYIVDAWAFVAFTVGIGIRGGEQADLGDAGI